MLLLVILLTSGYVTGIACPDIVSVQASSQTGNWNPENLLNTAHGTYWMSEVNENQDEWVRFEFAEPAVVDSAEIRYNNGRQGSSPKIQGSNDAVSWDDLAEVEPWEWPNDSDNFRMGVVDLPNSAPTYKYFRYHSGPTVYVLLNHITFECAVPEPQIACPDIVSVQASSQTGNWNPENVLNTAHGTYWMSEVNNNQDEWVQIEFAEPAAVDSAEIRYNNGRQGSSPKIQGSNDAVSWDDLAEVEPWNWPNDSDNFRKGVVDLPDSAPTYKYFRYHSGPTVYVLLNHITFECAAPQPQIPVTPACPNVVSVQASTQTGNWNPENLLNTAHGTYWMSEVNGNQDEWVQFEFAEPAVVGSAEIRYNNGRQGSSPKIQGSNDAVSWDDLAEVESWDWPNDSDNFRKGVVDLPDWAPTYKYFRYHSGPTVYVLLNDITFECVAPQPQIPVPPAPTNPGCWIFLPTCASGSVSETTQWFFYDSEMADVFEQRCIDAKAEFDTVCGGNADALTHYVEDDSNACPDVQSVQASSQTGNWNPDNLLNTEHRTYWMSEVNGNQNEWVRFEFMAPTLVSSLKVRLNNGRQGSSPKIQGSQDGVSWDDLASVNSWQWPNDMQNFRYGIIELNAPAYKFFRYHSGPTVYVLINHIQFQCASPPNNLKLAVQDAFDAVKATVTGTESFGTGFQRKFALPALIRKAFHDAGHFDQASGEMRLGCIQHFMSGPQACGQHAHFEKAEDFRIEVESMLQAENVQYSLADVVQLLGALAVDELAQGTGADLLYPKMKIGRTDVSQENCEADQAQMCARLPDFHDGTGNSGHGECDIGLTCNQKVEDSLGAVWEHQIEAKMMGINSLSKQDAVSLIGAHTVGKHFSFGAWVTNPMVFDNDYWIQLQKLKQHLDNGGQFGMDQNHVYSESIFPDWFQDEALIDNQDPAAFDEFKGSFGGGKIMMLDSDLTLVLNAPELVDLYADEPLTWRQHFDAAYVKMGELGVTGGLTNPDTGIEAEITVGSKRSRNADDESRNADDEAEFFQNLNLLREKQLSRAHEIHAQAKEANAIEPEFRKSMESASVISNNTTNVFAVIGLVSFGYFAFSVLRSCFVKQNYQYIADPETLEY